MTRFAIVSIVGLLALCSWAVGSDSEECEDLVRYLKPEDINLIFGNWTVGIAAADKSLHKTLLERTSSWFELKPVPNSKQVTFIWGERKEGVCTYGSENSTAHGENEVLSVESEMYKGQYLHTCQGCLQGITKAEINGTSGRYFIMAKDGGNLTTQEQQMFEKKAACLHFPPVFFSFPPSICPPQV